MGKSYNRRSGNKVLAFEGQIIVLMRQSGERSEGACSNLRSVLTSDSGLIRQIHCQEAESHSSTGPVLVAQSIKTLAPKARISSVNF